MNDPQNHAEAPGSCSGSSILEGLTGRDAEILRLLRRHHAGDRLTLGEVGFLFGMSKQGVAKIEEKALRKLRLRCRAAGLSFSDLLHG